MSIKDTTRELADIIQKDYLVYNPESQNLETKKGAIDAVIKHTGVEVTEKEMDAVFGLTNQFVAATALGYWMSWVLKPWRNTKKLNLCLLSSTSLKVCIPSTS